MSFSVYCEILNYSFFQVVHITEVKLLLQLFLSHPRFHFSSLKYNFCIVYLLAIKGHLQRANFFIISCYIL